MQDDKRTEDISCVSECTYTTLAYTMPILVLCKWHNDVSDSTDTIKKGFFIIF